MKGIRELLLLLFLGVTFSMSLAQQRAYNWYFGDKIGINFSGATPQVLSNSAMKTIEGCATISDTNGNLLFYTDGSTIWDKTHAVMQNGSGLMGHPSSTQSGVIIPYPGNNDKYYVFTVDERLKPGHKGFHYNIVDVSKNSGNGEVIVKNIQLLTDCTEKVTGVRHCNSGDVWVITHGWNTNRFYAYLITSTGLQLPPVTSNSGLSHTGIAGNSVGYLKASPDGRRLACAMGWTDKLQYFDFNAESGLVSNPTTITFPSSYTPYGVEFSNNGDLLYVSSVNQGIYQIDLLTNNRILISTQSTSALQIATNGRIYCAQQASNKVGVINNPNVLGTGCNHSNNALTFPRTVWEGLPTFNQSLFEGGINQNFTIKDTCFGDTTKFNFTTSVIVDSVRWDFGDTTSAFNTGSGSGAKHYYDSTGDYTVKLSIYNLNCPIPFILEKTLHINPKTEISLRSDTIICDYDSIRLKLIQKNATGFTWYNGNFVDSAIFVKAPGTYDVTAYGVCNTAFDQVVIDAYEDIDVEIPDEYLCQGDSILLDAFFPNATYNWQDNSTNSTFMVKQPGNYSVSITTECYLKKLNIQILEDEGPPQTNLGNDTMICIGDSLNLNAKYLISKYNWSNGSTDSVIAIGDSGTYFVKVTFACYESYDTIHVGIIPNAELEIGKDTAVCFNTSYVIAPKSNMDNLLWMDGTIDDTYEAKNEGWYSVSAENICNKVVDSLYIFHDYPPSLLFPPDTSICVGFEFITLNAYTKGGKYLWQDGTNASFYNIQRPGTYNVKVKNNCGVDFAMVDVRERDCVCNVYVPNAFTPNDDDVNAGFGVEFDCELTKYKMSIFNRWGELIYQTLNPLSTWDGRFPNGELAPIDAYVYYLEYTGVRNNEVFSKEKRGIVNLLR